MRRLERETLETARLRLELAAMVSEASHRSVRGKRRVNHYAQRLIRWLDDVAFFVHTPETGVDVVLSFFESDQLLLSNCTDIDHTLQSIFTQHAFHLLRDYARRLEHFSVSLGERILDGILNGREGIRETLLSLAAQYMPTEIILHLHERAKDHAKACGMHTPESYRWLDVAAVLAREALDEKRFLETLLMMYKQVPQHAHLIVAEIRMRRDNIDGAIQKILEVKPAEEDLDFWDDLGIQLLDKWIEPEKNKLFSLIFFACAAMRNWFPKYPIFFREKPLMRLFKKKSNALSKTFLFLHTTQLFL